MGRLRAVANRTPLSALLAEAARLECHRVEERDAAPALFGQFFVTVQQRLPEAAPSGIASRVGCAGIKKSCRSSHGTNSRCCAYVTEYDCDVQPRDDRLIVRQARRAANSFRTADR